jgi:hypothetical protein
MSKRVLIALVVIVLIIVFGMVVTMKRAMRAGAKSPYPDAAPASAAPKR